MEKWQGRQAAMFCSEESFEGLIGMCVRRLPTGDDANGQTHGDISSLQLAMRHKENVPVCSGADVLTCAPKMYEDLADEPVRLDCPDVIFRCPNEFRCWDVWVR